MKNYKNKILLIACTCLSLLTISLLFMAAKNKQYASNPGLPTADTTLIHQHLTKITKTDGYRTHTNTKVLNQVAAYIHDKLGQYADETHYQDYEAKGSTYRNVVATFKSKKANAKTIVIGAHYDACGDQEGADDNASGVVGLLELARLLEGKRLDYNIEMVAYSLEEPPFFRTDKMGSYIHATSVLDRKDQIYGMICLEMIGYFDSRPNTQDYPLGFLSAIYGNKGDYITLVRKFASGGFARKFSRKFRGLNFIKTKQFIGPTMLQGIDFSDHLNYWKYGISALMITDTAFYRNKNYHQKTDTMDTLDLPKMAKVIDSVYQALLAM
ncbi:MAG: M28 family peptidase [Chitinophagales bacterium]